MNNKQYLALVVTLSLMGFSLNENTAEAAIPDEEGIFTGCVSKIGSIRLIDADKTKCSRIEKTITWSQGQDIPFGGPFIVDAKGQYVGKLIEHVTGGPEDEFANYAGITINGKHYYVLVSEGGFGNNADSPFVGYKKYYQSSDCTGDVYWKVPGVNLFPTKQFSNWKQMAGSFVYENKLYEYDAYQYYLYPYDVFINSRSVGFPCNGAPLCFNPTCELYNPSFADAFVNSEAFYGVPSDAYYEVADLSNFEPPFRLVVD